MENLTREQQQLILDFYFRCGDPKDIEKGRDLVAATPGAAKLYARLEDALTDLDHIKYESCPDNLVDLTVARLKLVATSSKASNARLHQLLKQEQAVSLWSATASAYKPLTPANAPRNSKFFRPLFEVLAAAASIALVAGILFPSFGFARAKSRQIACQKNMGALGAGLFNFVKDHDQNNEALSEVMVKDGSSWWKIGDQGPQTRSNTRYPFMVFKDDYVDGRAFVCKGNRDAEVFRGSLDQFKDFPSHKYISYSFTLFCNKNANSPLCARKVIASDLNPVFQKVRCDKSSLQEIDEFGKIHLNDDLKQRMSINHRGQGQNILYGDGSVKYIRSRILNGDDIFTISGVDVYTGREIPSCSKDIFLVP